MNITILLLVSGPIVRSIRKETLEHEGYTVVAAGDLCKAVERIKECPPGGFVGARRSDVSANEMPEDEGSYSRAFLMTSGFNLAKRCKDSRSSQGPTPLRSSSKEVKHILSKPPRG